MPAHASPVPSDTDREGVIKYRMDHRPCPLPPDIAIDELAAWRDILFLLGLTGADPNRYDGLAYGNVSLRLPGSNRFVVSGTQTGGLPTLDRQHFCIVESFDLAANHLSASGPVPPSSEALTHAAVYQERPEVDCVLHVHSPSIWLNAHRLGIPATAAEARYGSPEMVAEVTRLLRTPDTNLMAMAGHEDGLIALGLAPRETALILVGALARVFALKSADAPQ